MNNNIVEIEIAVARRTGKMLFEGITQPPNQPQNCVKGIGRITSMSKDILVQLDDGRAIEGQSGDTVEFFIPYTYYTKLMKELDQGVEILNLDGSKSNTPYFAATLKANVDQINHGWIKSSKLKDGVLVISLGCPEFVGYEPYVKGVKGEPLSRFANIKNARINSHKEKYNASLLAPQTTKVSTKVSPKANPEPLAETLSEPKSESYHNDNHLGKHAQVNADVNLDHLAKSIADTILERLNLAQQLKQ